MTKASLPIRLAVFAAMFATVLGCTSKGRPPRPDARVAPPGLREQLLQGKPADFGIAAPPAVWGVMMDMGIAEGPGTFTALSDGSASLYWTGGVGLLRDNGRARVRAGAARVCELAAEVKDMPPLTGNPASPKVGWVRFILLTTTGTRSAEVEAAMLGDLKHPLSRLFLLSNDVITRLKMAGSGI